MVLHDILLLGVVGKVITLEAVAIEQVVESVDDIAS